MNMKTIIRQGKFLFILPLFVSLNLQAQVVLEAKPDKSLMLIKGTSNLHDWEENVGKFKCEMVVTEKGHEVQSIDKVKFSCKATDIKSDHSLMDDKTQDALKSGKFPAIDFKMVSLDSIESKNGHFNGILSGNLNLAGVTKKVSIPFTGSVLASNNIEVNVEKKIVLKNFNITPPTAMFGTLKTGSDVTLQFKLLMVPD